MFENYPTIEANKNREKGFKEKITKNKFVNQALCIERKKADGTLQDLHIYGQTETQKHRRLELTYKPCVPDDIRDKVKRGEESKCGGGKRVDMLGKGVKEWYLKRAIEYIG